MALFLANGNGGVNGGATILHSTTRHHQHHLSNPPQLLLPLPPRRPPLHIVSATNNKKLSSSSRTGKFDSKNRRNSPATATTTTADQEDQQERQPVVEGGGFNSIARDGGKVVMDDGFVLPKLPGEEPDFWEGPQWDTLGFFVQYLWAFGVVFALIACGIAVVTYNEGATDFKDTPVYKESVQSQELLEEPEGSNADVFESNPTEVAPSLE